VAFQLYIFPESVTDTSYRIDESVLGVFNFTPQPSDMYVYSPITAEVIVTPYPIQQSLAGKNTPAITNKKLQQLILFKG
jgi:hypothetical protein